MAAPEAFQPIFQHICGMVINGDLSIVLEVVNRCVMVGITLILYGTPLKIVQRGQIVAARQFSPTFY